MAMTVAEKGESKESPPSSRTVVGGASENTEPPPPGTEDDVPVQISSKSVASVGGSAPDEPPPPGTEDAASVQTSSRNTLAVTSSSAIDDEHEEGEIQSDDDEGEGRLEYEDISSEEETNIRERIAQLEAMDDELGKIHQITGASSDDLGHYAFDKRAVIDLGKEDVFECISDEEDVEMYLRRYEPIPKPKLLPVQRKRRVRPLRTSSSLRNVGSSSVNRRHGDMKRKAEKRKHEQQSARKSNMHRNRHKRRKQHMGSSTLVNIVDSTDSEPDYHPIDRARLQVACNINAGKRKTDKENWDALKQKLKLQMQKRKQRQSETSKEVDIITDKPMDVVAKDDEDDEVLQLRLQALKSKAELQPNEVISLVDDPITPQNVSEEQQLRLDALRSAFTKKHEKRLQKKQGERPYSPSDELFLLASPIEEEEEEDDEVQIIEKLPETVEIPDSSDEENGMQLDSDPQCPKPPPFPQIADIDSATSNESRSPTTIAVSSHETPELHDDGSPELEPPSPPIIGDLQSKLPDEDDEETLRNQLLSNLSSTALRPTPIRLTESRPMTPDSMGEEEADALRELILSKMHKKASKKLASSAPKQSEDFQKTDSPNNIPNGPNAVPCEMEPLTISISDPLPVSKETEQMPLSALNPTISTNQLKVQSNPNLITLIGKQKITRKKRKKSLSAAKKMLHQSQQTAATTNQVLAIAVPLPSRTLIKAPVVQTPSPPPLMVTTKKLVNNPNKLINLNAPLRIVHSPKERSNLLETYVQKPVAKMIIQVGQSDSDSDPDYYPAPDIHSNPAAELAAEMRLQEAFLRDLDNASPSRVMLESPTYSPTPTVNPDGDGESLPEAPSLASNDVPFEQRLDQFLKTVRSKIDQSQAVAATVSTVVAREGGDVVKTGARTAASTPMTAGSGVSAGRGSVAKAARKPIMAPAAPNTPLAVRHLPKSAQLEYRRLVARMAQLEKQKQQRVPVPSQLSQPAHPAHPLTKTIINTGPGEATGPGKSHELVVTVNRDRRDVVDLNSPVSNPPQMAQQLPKRGPEPLVKRVLINNAVIAERENVIPRSNIVPKINHEHPPANNGNTSADVESAGRKESSNQQTEVSTALRRLPSLKEEDRLKVLRIAENRFEKHSQKFAQELQDLIGTVEHAQAERQKQYDLENKVAFLKDKLTVLERALSVHKKRLDVIFPELQESHTKVMSSRKRSIELNNLCMSIGREIYGSHYSPPSTARTEIHEQLKVLTTETKRLKDMRRLSLAEFKELTAEQRRIQQERQKQSIEQELAKSATTTPEPPDQKPMSSAEHVLLNDDGSRSDTNESTLSKNPSEMDVALKQYAKSAPASRSASPIGTLEQDACPVTLDDAADVASQSGTRFEKYTSPLAFLKNQSALNIPDGVICPYQMRGECIDQDCKFDHLK